MTQYRVCRLRGCGVWRVERLTQPRWPFSLLVKPRWIGVVERVSDIEATRALEHFERHDRERAAREARAWDCITPSERAHP